MSDREDTRPSTGEDLDSGQKADTRNLKTNFTIKHLELLDQINSERETEEAKKQEYLRMVTTSMASYKPDTERLKETLTKVKAGEAAPKRDLSVGFKRITNKHLDEHVSRNHDIGRGLYKNLQTQDMIKFVSRSDFNMGRQVQIMDCIRAFKIDFRHIIGLKRAFMDCEMDE